MSQKFYGAESEAISQARGVNSHGENRGIATGTNSHAEGDGATASGSGAHAEGQTTTASGGYSHAEGANTQAQTAFSHAEGSNSIASGGASHAEGLSTTASGTNAHAEGQSSNAANTAAHSEGVGTLASGSSSHAEGYYTTASANASHSGGWYAKADVQGSWARNGFNPTALTGGSRAQVAIYTLGGTTSGTTPGILSADTSTKASNTMLVCPTNSGYQFRASTVCRRSGGGANNTVQAFVHEGLLWRDAGSTTAVSAVGTQGFAPGNNIGTVSIGVDTANNWLTVTVTGLTAVFTHNWVCVLYVTELSVTS